ncbi:MAG: hypothetical protein P4L03_06795 [Terracidiphilus sp.]|nr:hypothetical protein [Terracidiphilus sp.]
MIRSRIANGAGLLALTVLAAGLAGCRVHVDKDANGEEKRVQVDTPFGGLHVNTDQTTATDLGLPVYPGALQVKGDDSHKSADVHMGFGEWQLRVRAVSYETADSREQVEDFYKKALGRYGDVLVCQNHQPIGTPKITAEGLTCEDNGKNGTKIDINGRKGGLSADTDLQLKAGSKRHQHIVGFEESKGSRTKFALVALDLPVTGEGKNGKSD